MCSSQREEPCEETRCARRAASGRFPWVMDRWERQTSGGRGEVWVGVLAGAPLSSGLCVMRGCTDR